jgi:hypothetical protein
MHLGRAARQTVCQRFARDQMLDASERMLQAVLADNP